MRIFFEVRALVVVSESLYLGERKMVEVSGHGEFVLLSDPHWLAC